MKRRVLLVVLLLLAAFACVFSLGACTVIGGSGNGGGDTVNSGGDSGVGDSGGMDNEQTHTSHNYEVSVVAPTCVDRGYTLHLCACGDSYKDNYTDATGIHVPIYHEAAKATCSNTGTIAYWQCKHCNAAFVDEQCSVEVEDVTTPKKEHEFENSYRIDKQATCDTKGIMSRHCLRCEATTDEVAINELGHDLENYSGKQATCTEPGYADYVICKRCDYTTYHVINALGHSIKSYPYKAETCMEAGHWGYEECSRCGYSTYVEIPKLAHQFDEESHFCKECGTLDQSIWTNGLAYEEVKKDNELIGYNVSGIGNATDKDIYIPELYNGKPVIGIVGAVKKGNYYYGAFSNKDTITSVTIPKSVTNIGDGEAYDITSGNPIRERTKNFCGAFSNCSNLTRVVMSNYVSEIGDFAFINCHKLVDIVLPTEINRLGDSVFMNCDSIRKIELPHGVTSIGATTWTDIGYNASYGNMYDIYKARGLFYGCSKLEQVIVPNSVTHIYGDNIKNLTGTFVMFGASAFSGCSSLTSITIPGSVTSITIPDSVTSIGECAFYGCSKLIQIENGVHYVDKWIIDCDKSVTSVTLRSNSIGIGDETFLSCSSLTSITIPNSVTSIGDWAFKNCSKLTSIEIPDSVTSIGIGAFYDCSILTSITYTGDIKGWCEISGLDNLMGYGISNKTLFIYGKEIVGNLVILTGVTSIGDSAFRGCSNLTSIEIPTGVTSIGDSAFRGCSSLTSIEIPIGVTSIGDSAFHGCSSLTSIEIPNSVTSIGDWAFNGCSGLTSIEIPNNVTSMGEYAFSGCSGLMSMVIPNSVTSIGWNVFSGCNGLTSIKFNDISSYCKIEGLQNLDKSKIYIGSLKLRELTSVTIGNGVTSIGQEAFYNCESLTSVTISDSVTSIGLDAFRSCSKLIRIKFNGTKAQWKAISKVSSWNSGAGNYTVTCTDGTLTKSES